MLLLLTENSIYSFALNYVVLALQDQTPAAEISVGGAGEAESGDRWPAAGEFLPVG